MAVRAFLGSWQEHRDETDPERIQLCIDNGVNGLLYLQQYTSFNQKTPNWSIGLFGNPIQDPNVPQLTLNELIAGGKAQELAQIAPPDPEYLAMLGEGPRQRLLEHFGGDIPGSGVEVASDSTDLEGHDVDGNDDGNAFASSGRGPEINFGDLLSAGRSGAGGIESGSDDLASAAASVSAAFQRKKRRRLRQQDQQKTTRGAAKE